MKLFVERLSKIVGGIGSGFGLFAVIYMISTKITDMSAFILFVLVGLMFYPMVVFLTKYLIIDTFFERKD